MMAKRKSPAAHLQQRVRAAHKGARYFATEVDGTRHYYRQTTEEVRTSPTGPLIRVAPEVRKGMDLPQWYLLLALHPAVSEAADEAVSQRMREEWAKMNAQPHTLHSSRKTRNPDHRLAKLLR